MSDSTTVNNQARPSMAAPILLGAVGAGAGAAFSPFVKKGYKSYEELLAMSEDTFEPVKKAEQLLEGKEEVQTAYNRLVRGRNLLSAVEDEAKELLKKDNGLEEILEGASEEEKKFFNDAIKDAKTAFENATGDAKKAAKEAYDKKVIETVKDMASKDAVKGNAEEVAKDMKLLKKVLPKSRWLGGILFAAVGFVVGKIIAKAIANKKNQA